MSLKCHSSWFQDITFYQDFPLLGLDVNASLYCNISGVFIVEHFISLSLIYLVIMSQSPQGHWPRRHRWGLSVWETWEIQWQRICWRTDTLLLPPMCSRSPARNCESWGPRWERKMYNWIWNCSNLTFSSTPLILCVFPQIVDNPGEVAEKADRIITMLPSSPNVIEVYTGTNGILKYALVLSQYLKFCFLGIYSP